MRKKQKPDASHEAVLFRDAPASARALLKSSHAAARLKARAEWWEMNKRRDEGKVTRG